MSKLKIVFFGTPEFAVAGLKKLVESGENVVGVVTVSDKPAGRGKKLTPSPVKEYALSVGLKVLQPEKLKSPEFIEELNSLHADLFIVIAFRMLPEIVWSMPPKGTFNLHGSLLPQYRGAAPINRAVMNGEIETGVTTFFLQHEIDTGNIIMREKIAIGSDETASELHDRMMNIGAELVLKTVRQIEKGSVTTIDQSNLIHGDLHSAPKLTKENTKLEPSLSVSEFHNFVRGLSLHPGAHTEIISDAGEIVPLKVYRTEKFQIPHSHLPGEIESDGKNFIRVYLKGGFVNLLEIQMPGKSRMKVKDLLNGWRMHGKWRMLD